MKLKLVCYWESRSYGNFSRNIGFIFLVFFKNYFTKLCDGSVLRLFTMLRTWHGQHYVRGKFVEFESSFVMKYGHYYSCL